ncbi:MAG: hypothetical protein GPOALKHO_000683 [Sodalis sp.]|nr:MAG: hypothetical protein GPOALKHO_000683 [Sodalis sp.]
MIVYLHGFTSLGNHKMFCNCSLSIPMRDSSVTVPAHLRHDTQHLLKEENAVIDRRLPVAYLRRWLGRI